MFVLEEPPSPGPGCGVHCLLLPCQSILARRNRDVTLWRADAGSVETRRRDDVRAFSWRSAHCRSRHCVLRPNLAHHHSAAQNSTRWQHLQPPAMPSTKVNGKIHRWDAVDALDGWQSHLNRTDHQQPAEPPLHPLSTHTSIWGLAQIWEEPRIVFPTRLSALNPSG